MTTKLIISNAGPETVQVFQGGTLIRTLTPGLFYEQHIWAGSGALSLKEVFYDEMADTYVDQKP